MLETESTECEFVVAMLLVVGLERVFKSYVGAFKEVLRGEKSSSIDASMNANQATSSIDTSASAETEVSSTNECDEDGYPSCGTRGIFKDSECDCTSG